jgi:hypothetical protein
MHFPPLQGFGVLVEKKDLEKKENEEALISARR